jgi:hypothetical protein
MNLPLLYEVLNRDMSEAEQAQIQKEVKYIFEKSEARTKEVIERLNKERDEQVKREMESQSQYMIYIDSGLKNWLHMIKRGISFRKLPDESIHKFYVFNGGYMGIPYRVVRLMYFELMIGIPKDVLNGKISYDQLKYIGVFLDDFKSSK